MKPQKEFENFVEEKVLKGKSFLELEKRFEFKKEDMISQTGTYGQICEVYDKNNICAGKFAKIKSKFFDPSLKLMQNIFCRSWEYFIADKLYNLFEDIVPKPEGVFAIKLKGGNTFFPGFVNEYNLEYQTLNKIPEQERIMAGELREDLIKKLCGQGFEMPLDVDTLENGLYSRKEKKFKFLDYDQWSYNGAYNRFMGFPKNN